MHSRNTQTALQFLFAFVLLAASSGFADAKPGTINGRVADPQGATVAGAKIKLLNAAGTKVAAAFSDGNGAFGFSVVDPGVYQVVAESSAFVSVTADVSVASGQQQEITLRFQQIVSAAQ